MPLPLTMMQAVTVQSLNGAPSDWDKLTAALGLVSFTNFEEFLDAIGLGKMPTMQRYGVLFGCCTFLFTLTAVTVLLFLGGSFKRLAEQAQDDSAAVPDSIKSRANRPLLLENLLESRHRMMKQNYPGRYEPTVPPNQLTKLTQMLLNVAPKMEVATKISALADDSADKKKGLGVFLSKILGSKNDSKKSDLEKSDKEQLRSNIPQGYEENYVNAYRRCQEKRGGPDIPGYPDARLEAYSRAYAGCGTRTSTNYRRSYARMYEAVACQNEGSMKLYDKLFLENPGDIIGRTVRLEPLTVEDHAEDLHKVTCGEGVDEAKLKPFNPKVVWGFLDCGPFPNSSELAKSRIFRRRANEAAFAIVNSDSNRVVGLIILTNDDPLNLSIELEAPIVNPDFKESVQEYEAIFLVLDRLFAYGYRRVQMTLDAKDHDRKRLPIRLGFMQEGMLPRHRIVKDASRDSNIYALLNNDWSKGGARKLLFQKIHGAKALAADGWNEVQESEFEMWQTHLQKENQLHSK